MTGSSNPAVEASGLVKGFGTTRAVDGIDLSVAVGSVYGFLGPNGVGKTTVIRMLATLLRPDADTARAWLPRSCSSWSSVPACPGSGRRWPW